MAHQTAFEAGQSIEMQASTSTSTPALSKVPSAASSLTHVQKTSEEKDWNEKEHNLPGHGESALPEDKEAEAIENLEEDWECDPENARNWPAAKKWTAVAIVRTHPYFMFSFTNSGECPQVSAYTFVSPLASSMMAPGMPEIAMKYGLTNSTMIALTLCIFLLSFAIGVSIAASLRTGLFAEGASSLCF